MNSKVLIAIGKIVKPFGLRGDLVISPMTDDTKRFNSLRRVFVGQSDVSATEAQVTHVVVETRGVRVRLANCTTRSTAETMSGLLLFVDEKDAIRPSEGAYFVHDLIGLQATDIEGHPLGVLKDVFKYPAQDVYMFDFNGSEVLIPAVKEFIKKIDLEKKTITLRLIDGMLTEPEVVEE